MILFGYAGKKSFAHELAKIMGSNDDGGGICGNSDGGSAGNGGGGGCGGGYDVSRSRSGDKGNGISDDSGHSNSRELDLG